MWTGETFETGGSKRWLVQKGSMAKALRKGIHLCVPKTPHMFRNSTDQLWGVCYSATWSWAKQSELGTKYYSRKQLLPMCRSPWFEIEHQKVSKAWPPHQAKFNDLIRFQNFQLVVASIDTKRIKMHCEDLSIRQSFSISILRTSQNNVFCSDLSWAHWVTELWAQF